MQSLIAIPMYSLTDNSERNLQNIKCELRKISYNFLRTVKYSI